MNNEKGITLIELLVAISILLIISPIIYGVLIGVNKNFNQITVKSNLEQEANLMISTIRSYHQREASYYLAYDEAQKKAYIGNNSASNLLSQNIVTFEVSNNAGMVNLNNPIYTNNFITVHIILKESGETVDINTVIQRY